MTLPYENATSGSNAVAEMGSILRSFGAESFGVMEDFAKGELIAQFRWRGRDVTVRASAKGYASAWLRQHPWHSRRRSTKPDYEAAALRQAQTSVYSILRDWIKGQVTAVGIGMLSFEGAFLGQIMLPSGQTVLERVTETKLLTIGER